MITRLRWHANQMDRHVFRLGQVLGWLILLTVLLSAGNAMSRYAFAYSSNAMLELQWYLFSAVFLLGGSYALQQGAHVRIDILSGRLSQRARAWIDIGGTLFFLIPTASMILYFSWPVFLRAFASGEISTNAGGLILWPARLLVPAAFALLLLQAVVELLKRIDELVNVPASMPRKSPADSADRPAAPSP